MLIGRESERSRIDRMLNDARAGRSSALVLRGEPGIGKSALLDHAAAAAGGARVMRALGVETESEFAYMGLHELVRPLLHYLDALPEVQADALRGALALAPPRAAGRLYIGAATLSLLSAAAEGGPVLCLIDDAHWLDAASAAALVFTARRLEAEGVVMLFAARDGFDARGVPEVRLGGLDNAGVARLLDARGERVDAAVAAALAAATKGNPLALRELSVRLSRSQLDGSEPLPHVLPVGPDLEAVYALSVEALSADARRALVLAATADTRAMSVLVRAEGAGREELEECESSGLLRVDADGVNFTHPLVRSAVYHRATPGERRDAHRALAMAFAGDPRYEERSAWHAAAAAIQPDEEVASRLEGVGAAAAERRAQLAAAAAFERAARLTPEVSAIARRLHLAARAARLAGQGGRAVALLDEAARIATDPVVVADVLHLRALADPRDRDRDAIVAAAASVEPHDRVRASTLLAVAAERGSSGGVEFGRRALELARGDSAAELRARLVLAGALLDRGEDVEAHDLLAACRAALAGDRVLRSDPELIVAAVETLTAVGGTDDPLTRELLDEVIAAARAHAVVVLPRALLLSARRHFESGSWTDAAVDFAEVARLASELGHERERSDALTGSALLAALRGNETEAAHLAEGVGDAGAAEHVRALATLAGGRVAAAIVHLETAAASPARPAVRGVPGVVAELVEAYVRAGRVDDAASATERAPAAESPLARAFLGDEAAFTEAVERAVEIPFVAARLRLARGEELRRAGARREARDELKTALEVFDRLGAEPWSERARRELRASGATLRKRDPSAVDELTPQELQIARLIAAGATQKEVAAELYLSPKTIEYHLRKVYRKLEITSARQLPQRLDTRKLLEVP